MLYSKIHLNTRQDNSIMHYNTKPNLCFVFKSFVAFKVVFTDYERTVTKTQRRDVLKKNKQKSIKSHSNFNFWTLKVFLLIMICSFWTKSKNLCYFFF